MLRTCRLRTIVRRYYFNISLLFIYCLLYTKLHGKQYSDGNNYGFIPSLYVYMKWAWYRVNSMVFQVSESEDLGILIARLRDANTPTAIHVSMFRLAVMMMDNRAM